ncbi:MAG: hypothetical protein WCL10_07700 [Novosphingobium sp.]|uniref:hypothetical protein n=1 Tax=Novosphingobium sp. TaxID=1874826 RepID=UPI00301A508C
MTHFRATIDVVGQFLALLAALALLVFSILWVVLALAVWGEWTGLLLVYRLSWLAFALGAAAFSFKAIGGVLRHEAASALRAFALAGFCIVLPVALLRALPSAP